MLQAQRDVIKVARERDAAVEVKDAAVEDAVKTATIQVFSPFDRYASKCLVVERMRLRVQ